MEHYDPYAYPMQFTEQEQKQFENGICYSIYEKLGAHPVKIDGVSGVYFAVWAPNAIRVSVVGDFNNWDGRAYQMNLLESGIYELFIPGVRAGDIYKYEIKAKARKEAVQVSQKDAEFVQSLIIYKDKDVIVLNKPSCFATFSAASSSQKWRCP